MENLKLIKIANNEYRPDGEFSYYSQGEEKIFNCAESFNAKEEEDDFYGWRKIVVQEFAALGFPEITLWDHKGFSHSLIVRCLNSEQSTDNYVNILIGLVENGFLGNKISRAHTLRGKDGYDTIEEKMMHNFSFLFKLYDYGFQNSVYIEIPVNSLYPWSGFSLKPDKHFQDYIQEFYIDTPKRLYGVSFIPENFITDFIKNGYLPHLSIEEVIQNTAEIIKKSKARSLSARCR